MADIQFPLAFQPMIQTPSAFKFIRGGRASAKSWSVARWFLLEGTTFPHRYLCTREVQKSIKDSVRRLMVDQINLLELDNFYEPLEYEIRGRNGSIFSFTGLSDQTAESIKSYEGYTRVWNEEGNLLTKRSWGILTPTIRADNSEIWTTYNPQLESDETHQRAVIDQRPGTLSIQMNWRDNPFLTQKSREERADDYARATAPNATRQMLAEYNHKWEGQCMPAVEGAIYFDEVTAAEMEGRFTRVPYDPLLKVHTIWDLGFNDSMAIILAQRLASEIRIIDYIEDSRRTIDSYVTELSGISRNWGHDWLPHDGFATRHQTGRADNQVLEALKRSVKMVPNMEVEQGIRAARIMFPRIYFNTASDGVKRLVECLKRYRRHISKSTNEAGAPLHDEFSHGADAFRYLCIVADQLSNDTASAPIVAPPVTVSPYRNRR